MTDKPTVEQILTEYTVSLRIRNAKQGIDISYDLQDKEFAEAKQAIELYVLDKQIEELNKVHRAGGKTDYDNATDVYIDERVYELEAERKN